MYFFSQIKYVKFKVMVKYNVDEINMLSLCTNLIKPNTGIYFFELGSRFEQKSGVFKLVSLLCP